MIKQILIELDAETAARLERAAPARSRRRSEFIRNAIRRALWEIEERETRAAYLRQPAAGDHRIAMAVGVLALSVPGVTVAGAEAVRKSYPRFFDDLAALTK